MPAPMALRGVRAVGGALLRPPSGALFRRALATIRRRTKCHSIGRYTERGLSTMPKAQSRWHHLYCTTMWRKRAKHQLRSQPLCEMCLKDGRINAVTIAITSSHIKVIIKNSFSASFSRFVSCTTKAPRNAKKRAATRLRSASTAGQSTQGIPYIRGAGGHEIFLGLPQNTTAAASWFCYICKKSPFFQ